MGVFVLSKIGYFSVISYGILGKPKESYNVCLKINLDGISVFKRSNITFSIEQRMKATR